MINTNEDLFMRQASMTVDTYTDKGRQLLEDLGLPDDFVTKNPAIALPFLASYARSCVAEYAASVFHRDLSNLSSSVGDLGEALSRSR